MTSSAGTAPLPASELGVVHFIGIGGGGMSGIARIMLTRGVTVTGSDAREARVLAALRVLGAKVSVGHDAANLGAADTVVVSTAINENNPELIEARATRVAHTAARRGAGRRHGRTTRGGGRRYAWQDHHDLDAGSGAAALWRGPVVRHWGRPERAGLECARRRWRSVHRRGRRERRIASCCCRRTPPS